MEQLAATYGISQPRTQAILLLKTWEEAEQAEGRVTEEDDAREAAVHEAHVAAVASSWISSRGRLVVVLLVVLLVGGAPRRRGRRRRRPQRRRFRERRRRAGACREDGAAAARGGPLGKFRPLRDDDALPAKPDPDAPAARAEHILRAQEARSGADAAHLRVPSRRWTFVVKDTTQRAVK